MKTNKILTLPNLIFLGLFLGVVYLIYKIYKSISGTAKDSRAGDPSKSVSEKEKEKATLLPPKSNADSLVPGTRGKLSGKVFSGYPLKVGSTGDPVYYLQWALNTLTTVSGGKVITTDGDFGPQTLAALQNVRKLPQFASPKPEEVTADEAAIMFALINDNYTNFT